MDQVVAEDSLQIGEIIDERYEILSFLGAGAAGRVYKARHLAMNNTVALKFTKKPASADALERIRYEARVLKSIQHPNIAKLYSVGLVGNRVYMALEFIEGETLAQFLAREGAISPQKLWPLLQDMCKAVAHIHEQNIVHRDIKPSNVMIAHDSGRCFLIDFGIAREENQDLALTRSGAIVGTPSYLAPEICAGGKSTRQSDVYSFGCLVFECLTGQKLFAGQSEWEILMSHLRTTLPNMPTFCEKLLSRCLDKDPNKRYSSFEAILEDLSNIDPCNVIVETKPRRPSIATNSRLVLGLSVLVVALIGVLAVLAPMNHSPASEPSLADVLVYIRKKPDKPPPVLIQKLLRALETDKLAAPTSQKAAYFLIADAYCRQGKWPEAKKFYIMRLIEAIESSERIGRGDCGSDKESIFCLSHVLTSASWLSLADSDLAICDKALTTVKPSADVPLCPKVSCCNNTISISKVYLQRGNITKASHWIELAFLEADSIELPEPARFKVHVDCLHEMARQSLTDRQTRKKFFLVVLKESQNLPADWEPVNDLPWEKDKKKFNASLVRKINEITEILAADNELKDQEILGLLAQFQRLQENTSSDSKTKRYWLARLIGTLGAKGDSQEQYKVIKEALALVEDSNGNDLDTAHIFHDMALYCLRNGKYQAAYDYSKRAYDITIKTKDRSAHSVAAGYMGGSLQKLGKLAEATKYLTESNDIARRLITKKVQGPDLRVAIRQSNGCAADLAENFILSKNKAQAVRTLDEQMAFWKELNIQGKCKRIDQLMAKLKSP